MDGVWDLRRTALLLLLVFCAAYLANLDSLRIVRDDWCNLSNLSAFASSGWAGWRKIITNEWVAGPRIFFFSWLIEAAIARFAGLSAGPYFLFIFGAHLCTALLVFRLLTRAGVDGPAAAAAATLSLVAPTSANALFFLNNCFFVIPVTLLAVLWHLYAYPLRSGAAQLAAVTSTALAAQFAGEQTLPLLYATFAFVAWRARGGPDPQRELARALAPAILCTLALALYARAYVMGHGAPLVWKASVAWATLADFARMHAWSFMPRSWVFGHGGIPPSFGTWLFSTASAAAIFWLFIGGRDPREERSRPSFYLAAVACLLAGWVGAFLPVLFGALTGMRTQVEPRYIYPTGLLLSVGAALALGAATQGWSARRRGLALAAPAAWAAMLMIYQVRDVWGTQKMIDERAWAVVDAHYAPHFKYLVTDSMQWAALMPAWSNAVSDFQEPWGMTCRMKEVAGVSVTPTRRYFTEQDRGDNVLLYGYRALIPELARKSEVLTLVFRYESKGRFADLRRGTFRIFPRFEEYQRYRDNESIEFAR